MIALATPQRKRRAILLHERVLEMFCSVLFQYWILTLMDGGVGLSVCMNHRIYSYVFFHRGITCSKDYLLFAHAACVCEMQQETRRVPLWRASSTVSIGSHRCAGAVCWYYVCFTRRRIQTSANTSSSPHIKGISTFISHTHTKGTSSI